MECKRKHVYRILQKGYPGGNAWGGPAGWVGWAVRRPESSIAGPAFCTRKDANSYIRLRKREMKTAGIKGVSLMAMKERNRPLPEQ